MARFTLGRLGVSGPRRPRSCRACAAAARLVGAPGAADRVGRLARLRQRVARGSSHPARATARSMLVEVGVAAWAGPADSPGRRPCPARARCAAGSAVSRPSAMTDAPQRPARSRSERSTARDESRSAPSWTSDRSILTMSKRNWLSRRSPALPAPTSSAAMRRPVRCSAVEHRSAGGLMSSTFSRSVSSTTTRPGSMSWRARMASSASVEKCGASIVRGEMLIVSS